jgi:lipoprotein-anchoring transpeptidase ErfK/SrfK
MRARCRLALSCAVAAIALIGGAAPAAGQPPLPGERIAAGVTAAGTDLSGLTADEAAARLNEIHGARLENGIVTVQAADITWTFRTADAVVQFDELQSAKRALYAGRDAHGAPVDVPLVVAYTKDAVEKFAATIDKRLYRPARDATLRISLRKVSVTHSRRGRDINRRQLVKDIGARLTNPSLDRVLKPRLLATKPKVTAEKLRASASTVITIDQKNFKLRLFKHLKVVKTYGVAVGQPQYPTPRGRFAIQSKQVNPVWSVPNSPWAGELGGTTVTGGSAANPLKARWMGVSGSVGIHGTGEDGSIGTRASHGCIRMHVSDVIALYKRVPIGTPVLIG